MASISRWKYAADLARDLDELGKCELWIYYYTCMIYKMTDYSGYETELELQLCKFDIDDPTLLRVVHPEDEHGAPSDDIFVREILESTSVEVFVVLKKYLVETIVINGHTGVGKYYTDKCIALIDISENGFMRHIAILNRIKIEKLDYGSSDGAPCSSSG